MEILLNKKPGLYVFGLVLFTVLAVFVFLPNFSAPAMAQDNEIPADQQTFGDDYGADYGASYPTATTGGPDRVSVLPDGSCPAGYTPTVAQTTTMTTICLRSDLITSSTAVLGGTPPPPAKEKIVCAGENVWGIPKWFSSPFTCGLYFAGDGILWLFAKLVFLAGMLFDFSIKIGIFKIKEYMDSGSVALVWGTVRDLANILFIFFLLWISIQTILGLDNAKKHLASIIIAALLINFSMFFARVIIAVSNILAVQFYNGIVSPECLANGNSLQKLDGCVSDRIMKAARMESVFNFGRGGMPGQNNGAEINIPNIILVTIFGSIFYIITAFLLLQAAFMFIGRTVALVLLTAVSPIAFATGIVPKLKKYSDDWWKNIIDQALVAPILLFFLWIIVFLTSGGNQGGLFGAGQTQVDVNNSLANALTGNGSMGVVFGFLFLIGLLFFALKITKEYSGKFGGSAVEFGSKVVAGTAGWALRGSIGRGMNLLSQNKAFQEWSQKNALTRGLHRYVVSPMGEANYDIRGAGDLPLGVGGALKASGAVSGLGKPGGKGGFKAFEKAATKADTDYAKGLSPEAQRLFAQSLKSSGERVLGEKGIGLEATPSMLQRFITFRTLKSTEDAAKTINKQVTSSAAKEADEERLDLLNQEYREEVKRALAGEGVVIPGLNGRDIAEVLASASKDNAGVIAKIEEKFEEFMEAQKSRKTSELRIAERERDTDKVSILSKELGTINTNLRKIQERDRLQRTVETRRNRDEQAQRSAPEKKDDTSVGSSGEEKK